jgi:hypothetical protein
MRNAMVVEPDDMELIAAQEQQGRIGPDHLGQGPSDQFQGTTRLVGLEQIARQCQQHTQLARRELLRFSLIIPHDPHPPCQLPGHAGRAMGWKA